MFYDKLSYKYIELPKFNRTLEQLNTNFERWIYLLKNLPTFENHPSELRGKVFDKLFKYAEIEQLSQNEMEEYKKSVLEYDDVQDAIEDAKGIAAESGRKEGIREGQNETQIAIAKKCLQKRMSLDEIADLTGLTKTDIQSISL